jgi:hypothetical protein
MTAALDNAFVLGYPLLIMTFTGWVGGPLLFAAMGCISWYCNTSLLFLLERDVTLFFDPLKTPTPDELRAIRQELLVETSTKLFDKTTRALTSPFQQRQGLSQQDAGFVDKIAADVLNERIRKLGALDVDTTLAGEGPRASGRHRRTSTRRAGSRVRWRCGRRDHTRSIGNQRRWHLPRRVPHLSWASVARRCGH